MHKIKLSAEIANLKSPSTGYYYICRRACFFENRYYFVFIILYLLFCIYYSYLLFVFIIRIYYSYLLFYYILFFLFWVSTHRRYSKSLLFLSARLDRISPEKKDCTAAISANPQTTSVGILGTRPVSKKVINIGIKNPKEKMVSNTLKVVKKLRGL